jgi:hypothetical protein
MKEFADAAPGGVVADGDGGVEDEAVVLGVGAVVDDVGAEDGAVGDDELDVFDGADAGDEEGFFGDVADRVGDADAVADLEGAHVGEDEAGDDVAHGGTGAEGDEDADEDGDAAEGGESPPGR